MTALRSLAIVLSLGAFLIACGGAPAAPAPAAAPRSGAHDLDRTRAPEGAPVDPDVPLPFQERTLETGLRVVVLERRGLPLASVRLVVARGLSDVGASFPDLVRTWAIVEERSDLRTSGRLAAAYNAIGAVPTSALSDDATSLDLTVLSADVPRALTALASQVEPPRADELRRLSRHVERLSNLTGYFRGNLLAKLKRTAHDALFGRVDVPREQLAPREEGEMLASMVDFHRRWVDPRHTALLVVGDVAAAGVFAAAGAAFATLRAPRTAELRGGHGPPTVRPKRKILFVAHDDPTQTGALVVARGPSSTSQEAVALDVLAHHFGGMGGPLWNVVRAEQGATYTFGAEFLRLRDGSALVIGGDLCADKVKPALQALLDAMTDVRAGALSEAATARARTSTLSGWRKRTSSNEGLVDEAARAVALGAPLASIADYPRRVRAVSTADLVRVARAQLSPVALQLVVVGRHGALADFPSELVDGCGGRGPVRAN